MYLLQAIDAKYAEVAARVGPDQEVMFEEEQITLDIPKEGLVLECGQTKHILQGGEGLSHIGLLLCINMVNQ